MPIQLNNALNAIEKSKLSLQQVLQNQRTPEKPTQPNLSTTQDCITPPKPSDDGSWTKVKANKSNKDKKGYKRATFPTKFSDNVVKQDKGQRPAGKTRGTTISVKLPNSHEVKQC